MAFTLFIVTCGTPFAYDGVSTDSAPASGDPKNPRNPAADPVVNNLTASGVKKLQRDPFYLLARSTTQFISENVTGELSKINTEIQKLDQDYMRLQMEFETDQTFYPDANLTLRLSYGTVKGYYSKDAV